MAFEQLFRELDYYQPKSVLLASNSPLPTLHHYLAAHHCQVTSVLPTAVENSFSSQSSDSASSQLPKGAFAIVFDYLEHLDKPTALQQLALWRNCHCSHIWLAVDSRSNQWRFQDFIALGFQRLGEVKHIAANGDSLLMSYGYDLSRYNHKRDWNNPRFWANPEHWGKRW